ncbi:MAG TPA: heavy metal-associated domain-containing protein [Candidatus Eisenbacteria bacterium]|jgi:copper chaperone CopZ
MKTGFLNGAALAAALVLLAAGGPWLARQIGSLPRAGALSARANQKIVTLEVGGMTCSGCASAVRTQIAALDGVAAVEVRLGQRRAYVVCDPAVPDSALTAAVGRAGPGFLGVVVSR